MTDAARNPGDRVNLLTRVVCFAEAALSLGAAAVLLLVPKSHADVFAFTIAPAMTASFMGANFAGGSVIKWFTLAERSWLNMRQGVMGVGVYVTAIGVASLAHLNSFNLSRSAAMVWVSVYTLLPLILIAVVAWQQWIARRGAATVSRGPALAVWLRALLVIATAIFLAAALGLLFAPGAIEPLWPWALKSGDSWGGVGGDPAGGMGGYIAGWLLGLAVTSAHVAWENDARRSRAVMAGGAVAGVLNLISCVRFSDDIRWFSVSAWVYLALLIAVVVAGVIGLRAGATPRSPPINAGA